MWDMRARGRLSLLGTADLWVAACLAAVGIYFFSGHFTTVRFDRERIDIRVGHSLIEVEGSYHYTNSSWLPAVLTLRVPFPVDPDHPAPEGFALDEIGEDGRALAALPPVVRDGNVTFRMIFRPWEEKWVRLLYAQPTRVSSGRYLLTTTRAWRRPMGRADYMLRLPLDVDLSSSNYTLSPGPAEDIWKTYAFSKTEFFPDQDWEFAWEETQAATAKVGGGVR